MNTNTAADCNIVRLTKGSDWARFEMAKGCEQGTLHNSLGHALSLTLSDARARIACLVKAGWQVQA